MSNEVTVRTGDVLLAESRSTFDGLMAVRETLAPDLTPAELQLFALVAYRSGLDPFAKQIYAVKRKGRMTIQTGIDGYRSIAARTGEYDGQDEPTYGDDCGCGKAPRHPESSTVRVYRKGMSRPVGATAFWHEYCPDAGQSGQGDVMWRKMPHVMIAKVAEALALRKCFPWDPNSGKGIGSDIYTTEEMDQAADPIVTVSVQERIASKAESITSLRAFADAVADIEPEEIRRVRAELYPEVAGVAGLTDEQRATLLARLRGSGVLNDPQGEEAVAAVLDAPEATVAEDDILASEEVVGESLDMVACEVPSPFTEGAVCILEQDHPGGFHRSGPQEAWPRKA